jgi:hypothetical protein
MVPCIPGICTCGREFEKEELMLAEKRQAEKAGTNEPREGTLSNASCFTHFLEIASETLN